MSEKDSSCLLCFLGWFMFMIPGIAICVAYILKWMEILP